MNTRLTIAGWLAAVVALTGGSGRAATADDPLPEAGDVIRRFVERSATASNHASGTFVYYRTNLTEEFDRKGRLDEREELLLRVTVAGDEQDVELLRIDGREPTDRERDRELRRFADRHDGGIKRERPDRSRQMDAYLTTEILSRYVFSVDGREELGGRRCLKVSFQPGAGRPKPDKLFERVLDKIHGVFWIDEADYQLAKADIQLGEKVSLWGGLLGALEQMRLQIERVRDPSGSWRDESVEARFVGRAVTRHIDVRTIDRSSAPQPGGPAPVVAAD